MRGLIRISSFKPWVVCLIGLGIASLPSGVRADSLVLKTGEVVTGRIVAETDAEVEIENRKYKGVVRSYPKTDIQPGSIKRDEAGGSSAEKIQTPAAEKPFSFTGNGFDFVVELSKQRGCAISVDPEVVGDLAKLSVEINPPATLASNELLAKYLRPTGLTNVAFALSPEVTVAFLTTPSAWRYYNATRYLRRGDFKSVWETLKTVPERSGSHVEACRSLRASLELVDRRSRRMAELRQTVLQSLDQYTQAQTSARNASALSDRSGFQSGGDVKRMGQDGGKMAAALAEQQVRRANDELVNAAESMRAFYQDLMTGNKSLAQTITAADQDRLLGQSDFVFDHLVVTYKQFADLYERMQTQGRRGVLENLLTEEMRQVEDLQRDRRAVTAKADMASQAGVEMLTVNPEASARDFARSYFLDRSGLVNHVGVGYTQIRNHSQGLDLILTAPTKADISSRAKLLERDFRSQGRAGLLQMLQAVLNRHESPGRLEVPQKIGSTKGLAISFGEGELFPIQVQVQPRRERVVGKTRNYGLYWGQLFEVLEVVMEAPIEFGDYGNKDVYTKVSAMQAYKWLASTDAGFKNSNLGLQIDVHDLFGGLGGDSAGVTIATSALSALKSTAVRQDIAMTGSIRSDGAVKGVGGVPQKIDAAAFSRGVETVIVPSENTLDLITVPVDRLCRVAIIHADEMTDYLTYATLAPTGQVSVAHQRAQKALTRLRLSQVLLLLGERPVAMKQLEILARDHPEVYNAGRLVEILNRAPAPAQAMPEQILSVEEAEKIVASLSGPPT